MLTKTCLVAALAAAAVECHERNVEKVATIVKVAVVTR